ncbi:hypothetical protein DFP72DRAFT_1146557 [Ephemerocybe angulata]|uniref:DUF6589 domain-containing protein n=1 Tax=Ephemerocybe angulata TaxID=980116 RepID=A0A8H6HM90_9AGAR|nr:hypothetical protein DFP72DRAFT_1146557 [Tulosesus angulatus]
MSRLEAKEEGMGGRKPGIPLASEKVRTTLYSWGIDPKETGGTSSGASTVLQIQAMYTPGAPHTTKKRRVLKTITAEEQAIASAAYQEKLSEKRENEKRMREEAERKREEDGVRSVLAAVQAAGFTSLFEFQKALHACKNQQISSQPSAADHWASERFLKIIQKEGARLVSLLISESGIEVSTVLQRYSIPELLDEARDVAPHLCEMLSTAMAYSEDGLETRKHKDVMLASLLSAIAQMRNERASTFQIVGLYACGAPRSLFEVLNHAGFTLSYGSAILKLKQLSRERLELMRDIVRTQPCMLVYDNVNIAFRVNEQRETSKDHFDNGTTATLIPLFSVKPSSLHLSLLTPRLTRRITYHYDPAKKLLPSRQQIEELESCFLWHMEDFLLQSFPDLRTRLLKSRADLSPPMIHAIPVHNLKSEQFPLPAALIDESTIDGTLDVLDHMLFRTLGLEKEEIEKHGVFFIHGDQLTISLLESASGSRREQERGQIAAVAP